MPTCLPLRVCCITRHFSTDISSLNVMKPNPRDMPSGFRSTYKISGEITHEVLLPRAEQLGKHCLFQLSAASEASK